jgi:hypothetical protein
VHIKKPSQTRHSNNKGDMTGRKKRKEKTRKEARKQIGKEKEKSASIKPNP